MIETLIDFLLGNWIFLLIIGVLLYVLWNQRKKVIHFASTEEFQTMVTAGYPVVAEFFDET